MKHQTYIRSIQKSILQYADMLIRDADNLSNDEIAIQNSQKIYDMMRAICFMMGSGRGIKSVTQHIKELAFMLTAPAYFVEMYKERKYTAYMIGKAWLEKQGKNSNE